MPTPTPLAVERIVQYFETLSPEGLEQIRTLYSPYARFVDPFSDVVGLPAIEGIFTHMFVALEAPRFVIIERIVQGPQCFLTLDFHFRFKNFQKDTPQTIRGGSHLVFSEEGLGRRQHDFGVQSTG